MMKTARAAVDATEAARDSNHERSRPRRRALNNVAESRIRACRCEQGIEGAQEAERIEAWLQSQCATL